MAKNGTKADKKAEENTDLVVPEHGNGKIYQGAPRNPVAGPGRPPSHIREHCRGSFAERVPILEKIADGEPMAMTGVHKGEVYEVEVSASIKERVQAIDTLGKYGGVDKLALTVDEQPEREMTPERIADIWERIQRIKSIRELEKLLVAAR